MTVYLVRHAESMGNLNKVHMDLTDPLSKTGIQQAKVVAERLTKIPIDKFITSDMARAKQTAQIISKQIKIPFEQTNLIRELIPPRKIVGISHDHPKAKTLIDLFNQNIHNPNFKYPGAENFQEFKARVYEFMKGLEKLKEDSVLVIAHGFPLRVMLGYMLFGEKFNSHLFVQMRQHMETTNTGITVANFAKENGWKLLTWNDHVHLPS